MFQAGTDACHPRRVLPPHLPEAGPGRTILLAVGKAAAAMAEVAEARYGPRLTGVAIVPHGVTAKLATVALIRAGHPVPDRASVGAAEALLDLAHGAARDDLLLCLLSGGASALACLPGDGLALADKQALTERLLRAGAPVGEVNCVRRHLSRIKGGRLALAAAPARIVTLAISDVVGGRPEDIGSGPTAPDPTSVADARAVLQRYGIAPPACGWSESPTLPRRSLHIVADAAVALEAAASEARRLGYEPVLLGECTGEAREIGRDHARLALASPPGTALISGGELVVTLAGDGRGGPNQEYALAAAIALTGREGILGFAGDTDGIDGNGEAAGAFFDGGTVARSRREAAQALAGSDSGGFFGALGDLLVTGPTGTNVSDLRIILVTH